MDLLITRNNPARRSIQRSMSFISPAASVRVLGRDPRGWMRSPAMPAWLIASCLAACSAGDDAVTRNGQAGGQSTGQAGSPSAGVAGEPTAGRLGEFGNPTMPQVAASGGGNGGATPPSTPMTTPGVGLSNEPIQIDACAATNAARLSAADAQNLMAGGPPGSLRFLYPYDGTVFPRGMLPPTIMWEGVPGARAVYLHIQGPSFEYKGCLEPTAEGQLTLPEDVWAKAGEKTSGGASPYAVELTLMGTGAPAGPIKASWTIAQATVKGSIYYNSYSSKLAMPAPAAGGGLFGGGGGGIGNGIVLRIPPGGKAEAFVSTECNGCHTVSANGARLLSAAVGLGAQSYALDQNTVANPSPMKAGTRGAFAALSPDGSVYLATSLATDVARATFLSLGGGTDATLYRTDDGSVVPSTGIPRGALMPMFSPDGSLLVFNDFAIDRGRGVAIVNYDRMTNNATGYRMLYKDTSMSPAWPFILPDNRGAIFLRTDSPEFTGGGAGLSLTPGAPVVTGGPRGDVHLVDIESGTVTILAKAMGFQTPEDASAEKTYLPFGTEELHRTYFPTLSPVAAGGYFWIFFDSVRHYGNLGMQRQLWGAAVDIAADGTYTTDRSHPAFYLPGQEFGTGNHRAFAALDPCKKNGDRCTSGTDCCGGFCFVSAPDFEFAEAVGTCAAEPPPMTKCSMTNERCTSNADCCPPSAGQPANFCIAGFCAMVTGPQ